ncbi:MAG: hypothetical protein IJ404_07850 [Clostridia bacterium]|nr:hypothetical protein [Clostridia bacterium]MBQ7780389.1 hypothetical protein [Clostridia bacterium]
MTSENQNPESVSLDSSYGGSTYRLSYDHKENKKSKSKKSFRIWAIIVIVISIALLFVFSYLALHNYNKVIKKLYATESTFDYGENVSQFQSGVTIVKD